MEYRQGGEHIVPDALSRRPDHRPLPSEDDYQVDHTNRDQQPREVATITKVQSSDALWDELREACHNDAYYRTAAQRIQLRDPMFKNYHIKEGILFNQDRVYIPAAPGLRIKVLQEHHKTPITGHLGRDKTLERVQRSYFWPGLDRDVRAFVRLCDPCQRSKARNQCPPGLLQPIPLPTNRWEQVTMDLITCLPQTKTGHTGVAVFVDRLSKHVHLAPVRDDIDAPGLACVFFDTVFRHHGLPCVIISDRDPRFTAISGSPFSNCWAPAWRSPPATTLKPTARPNAPTVLLKTCYAPLSPSSRRLVRVPYRRRVCLQRQPASKYWTYPVLFKHGSTPAHPRQPSSASVYNNPSH
jgi:hypothetical protein